MLSQDELENYNKPTRAEKELEERANRKYSEDTGCVVALLVVAGSLVSATYGVSQLLAFIIW